MCVSVHALNWLPRCRSGKTYTMYGDLHDEHRRGLIPRSLDLIFAGLEDKARHGCTARLQVTLIEIYNEQVIDLLGGDARVLQLREHPATGNVYVEGARVVQVQTAQETMALVDAGAVRRTVAATGANDASSRSHCILTLHLEVEQAVAGTRVVRESSLHLVDLAGSERQQKARAVGQRLKEASNINRSLSALGNVIMHLAEGYKHVPYRDSKLTFLLRNSIGGNSKTFFVANISAEAHAHTETVSTLKFASFASKSQLLVTRNQVCKEPDMDELKSELQRLHSLIHSGRRAAMTDADDVSACHTPARPAADEQLVSACGAEGDGWMGAGAAGVGRETTSEGGAREDKETIKRLQVLLWLACEREKKCEDKLARERAGFRSRTHEYERACTALERALEIYLPALLLAPWAWRALKR